MAQQLLSHITHVAAVAASSVQVDVGTACWVRVDVVVTGSPNTGANVRVNWRSADGGVDIVAPYTTANDTWSTGVKTVKFTATGSFVVRVPCKFISVELLNWTDGTFDITATPLIMS